MYGSMQRQTSTLRSEPCAAETPLGHWRHDVDTRDAGMEIGLLAVQCAPSDRCAHGRVSGRATRQYRPQLLDFDPTIGASYQQRKNRLQYSLTHTASLPIRRTMQLTITADRHCTSTAVSNNFCRWAPGISEPVPKRSTCSKLPGIAARAQTSVLSKATRWASDRL